jgi:hypothetical protein
MVGRRETRCERATEHSGALKVRDFAREDAGFFMAWRHPVLTARGVTLRMGA